MFFRRLRPTAVLFPSNRHHTISSLLRVRLLTVSVGCTVTAMFGTGLMMPVSAIAAEAQSETAREYSIPAGTLSDVLARYAASAGVQLVFDPQLLAGRGSNGLQGRYDVRAGFAQLLAGSGYELVDNGGGRYGLRQMTGTSGAMTLPPVTVAGSLPGTTEGTGSYTTNSMSTATRLNLSMRETPQSVTVITRDRLNEQAMITTTDIMQNTTGIAITASAPYRETFYARGFHVDNYMFDGLAVRTNDSRRAMFVNDMAMYDRIEVVRGSAGLTQGTGTPSAAINFVRKRPTRDFQSYIQGRAGRWNYLNAEADVSGSLNRSGSVRGRAVAQWYDSDSFMDVVTESRQLVYAIGEIDISDSLMFTLSGSHQDNDNDTTYGGLPTALDGSDLGLPRSTYYGNTWNYWNDTTKSLYSSLEQRLAGDWKWSLAVNHIEAEQEQLRAGVALGGINPGEWDQSGGKASINSERTTWDLNAQGPFSLFGREHELVVGASLRESREGNDTAGYWPPIYFAYDIDLYNWNHDAPLPATFVEDFLYVQNEEQHGVYATANLHLTERLMLITGARLDWYSVDENFDIYDHDANTWTSYPSEYDHDQHLTKYFGLVYELNDEYSLYTSYSDIFEPQNVYAMDGSLIDPILGENYEVGIKGEYFDGALNASASVFRLDQNDLGMPAGECPFNATMTCYRAAGLVRSEGYEFEVQGALLPNWEIAAGFTYVNTKVEKDSDPATIGTRLNTTLPARLLKLSTTYRLGTQWRLGGNLRWQSEVFHWDDWMGHDYRTDQDAYAVVDAMVGYQVNANLDIQLNLSNLFDEVYFSAINGQPVEWGGNTVYGEPRNFMLTVRHTF